MYCGRCETPVGPILAVVDGRDTGAPRLREGLAYGAGESGHRFRALPGRLCAARGILRRPSAGVRSAARARGDALSVDRVEGALQDPVRAARGLFGDRAPDRPSRGGARRGRGKRRQSHCGRDSVPPRGGQRRLADGLRFGPAHQELASRPRGRASEAAVLLSGGASEGEARGATPGSQGKSGLRGGRLPTSAPRSLRIPTPRGSQAPPARPRAWETGPP